MFNEFNKLHDNRESDSIPYFSFYDLEGNLIRGDIDVTFDDNGQFDTLVQEIGGETVIYLNGQYTYTTECLYVLGIGFLLPGDIVRLKIDDCRKFELNFGWHTNVSNQTIYSWYLKPIKLNDHYNDSIFIQPDMDESGTGILTFYKEYLKTIEVVEFIKDRNYFNVV